MRWLFHVALCGLVLGVAGAAVTAEDDKVPKISKIMQTQHGKNGVLAKIESGLKKSPDWEGLGKLSTEYSKQISYLGKNEPPVAAKKGLWKELTGKVAKSAKELDDEVKTKDAKAALGVVKNIRGQCMKCHGEFRE
jgi:cytochrome c556